MAFSSRVLLAVVLLLLVHETASESFGLDYDTYNLHTFCGQGNRTRNRDFCYPVDFLWNLLPSRCACEVRGLISGADTFSGETAHWFPNMRRNPYEIANPKVTDLRYAGLLRAGTDVLKPRIYETFEEKDLWWDDPQNLKTDIILKKYENAQKVLDILSRRSQWEAPHYSHRYHEIRYLHMEPCFDVKGVLRSCNLFVGRPIASILSSVENGIYGNSMDILILHFQLPTNQYKLMGKVAKELARIIKFKLGKHLIDNKQWPPYISDMTQRKKRVIVIFEDFEPNLPYDFVFDARDVIERAGWIREPPKDANPETSIRFHQRIMCSYQNKTDKLRILAPSLGPNFRREWQKTFRDSTRKLSDESHYYNLMRSLRNSPCVNQINVFLFEHNHRGRYMDLITKWTN